MAAFAPGKGSAAALSDAVSKIVAPEIAAAGLFLEEVVVASQGPRLVVQITVDLPEDQDGGLGPDALGDISRAISKALDVSDPFPGEYTLEVSTPGLSRALTERRHFARARGRMVSIERIDMSEVTGRVLAVTASEITLAPELTPEEPVVISLDEVREGRIQVEFKRPDSGETSDEQEDG